MPALALPQADGSLKPYQLTNQVPFEKPEAPEFARKALAAAHVVANPLAAHAPWQDAAIDWARTLAYREHLWSHGLMVAEAMDTAQRGMGFSWANALTLIERSIERAQGIPGADLYCGVGTDHLEAADARSLSDVTRAYIEQIQSVQKFGGKLIVMASRALASCANTPADYMEVYTHILQEVDKPVILHWLGDMFDPALTGYWGSTTTQDAMDHCLAVIEENQRKIEGIKISLLDKDAEITMRRRLPTGVTMYTGDDFNFADLIEGDSEGYSEALLGIFDPIAPAVSVALQAHASGDIERYREILGPTVPLSRKIFEAPTRFYKTGVVFMAYINGHQDHFHMIGGQQSARSLVHFAEVFELADRAGLIANPEMAIARMKNLLALGGIE